MKIIDIGNAIYVVSQIAYMSKDFDSESEKPTIKMFLTGISNPFVTAFDSEKLRDEIYEKWRKIVEDYEKTDI